MAEITTTAVGAVAAGAGATILSSLGLDPPTLFWALVGATVGLSFAPAMSRFRAVVVFLAVVLSCALIGAWLAQQYYGGGMLSRHVAACVLALFFHLLVSLAQTKLPALWDAVVVRWVGPGAEKP